MRDKQSLLDHLHTLLGCEYLSDMRVDGRCNFAARSKLKEIKMEGYPVSEWDDALQYVSGVDRTADSFEESFQQLQMNKAIHME